MINSSLRLAFDFYLLYLLLCEVQENFAQKKSSMTSIRCPQVIFLYIFFSHSKISSFGTGICHVYYLYIP